MSYFDEVAIDPPADIVAQKIEQLAEHKAKSNGGTRARTTMPSIDIGSFSRMGRQTAIQPQPSFSSLASATSVPSQMSRDDDGGRQPSTQISRPASSNEMATYQSEERQIGEDEKELLVIDNINKEHKYFVSMTGLMVDWSPTYWELTYLPHKTISVKVTNTLETFAKAEGGEDTITFSGEQMNVFTTVSSDLFFLYDVLQDLHGCRQRDRAITPFVITAEAHSDLPFPVSVVSQSVISPDGVRMVPDMCNRKIKRTASGGFYPVMFDIFPALKPSKEKIVTDFRKDFSLDSIKTAFFMDMAEIHAGIRSYKNDAGNMISNIREHSKMHRMIVKLSENKLPVFSKIQKVAEDLRVCMNKVPLRSITDDVNSKWFVGIPHLGVQRMVDFAEQLLATIPIFKFLSYKFIPDDGVKWNDPFTWSNNYLSNSSAGKVREELSLRATEPQSLKTAMTKTALYSIWMTLKFYYV